MASLFGILDTGRISLLSQQSAIQTAGHNIANANTEGYSRQEVSFQAALPVNATPGMLGTGVKVTEIKRAYNAFINSQINFETYTLGNYKAQKEILSQVEVIFNETTGSGLGDRLNQFFSAFQDLSVNPQGLAEREAVLGKSDILANTIQRLGSDLQTRRSNTDNSILRTTDDVNRLTSQIAQLNRNINQAETGPAINANDLRDQRDVKIKDLADLIDIQVLEESNNQLSITTTRGRHLVIGQNSFSLSTQLNGNNFGLREVMIDDGNGNLSNITSEITGGQLYGMLDVRDNFLTSKMKKLDIFTSALVREVNKLHRVGYGINGSTGNNFFNTLSVTTRANTNNSGSATISGSVFAPSTASVDEFQIQITGSNTFTLTDLTTNSASATYTFSSGSAVNLGNGISITISGSAQTNDIFTFSQSENSASSIAVNSTLLNNSNKIAAGTSNLKGDGSNALNIVELQNSLLFESQSTSVGSGTFTFENFYGSIVSSIGIKAEEMNSNTSFQENVIGQLINRREEISGVSLDEEMINLVKYQQAFAAAARIITSVNEMLTTVRDMVR